MKISRVTPHLFVAPLARPIADARNRISARATVLVRVDTDDGLFGWGEAASFAGCGALVVQTVRFFAERLIGADASDPSGIYDRLFRSSLHFGRRGLVINALSGIDVALWDLKGKAEGRPVHRLLGASRGAIDFYFNGGYFVDDDPLGFVRRSAERAVAAGARALKIKIGRSVADDARRIAVAREVLGSDRDLMVDANGILDLNYLLALDPILRGTQVRWMEEPVALAPAKQLREIRAALKTPIAGYELEQTADGWNELIDSETMDIAQPDAIWSGGIGECMKVAERCARAGIEFVPHNFASIVSLAANAHLAAAAPTGGWLEVDSNENPFLWPLDRLGAFALKDGKIAIPEVPGLGVEPDLARIERFRVNVP